MSLIKINSNKKNDYKIERLKNEKRMKLIFFIANSK